MNELIKLKTSEGGKKTVSAKELYLGLGLNKAHWSRWYPTNIIGNEFFKDGYDYIGFTTMENGNETMDFEISLEFAKHIAMMARTEKSHQFRNYFLMCEAKLKEQQNMIGIKLSPMEILETQFKALKEQDKKINIIDEEVKTVQKDLTDFKDNSPLFNTECKELQSLVKSTGVHVLGGKSSQAYKDNSLRQRVYQDIQRQIKREFGVVRYESIKRCQFEKAKWLVDGYALPIVLEEEVTALNNQMQF